MLSRSTLQDPPTFSPLISRNVRAYRSPRWLRSAVGTVAAVAAVPLGLSSVGTSVAFADPVGVQPGTPTAVNNVLGWGNNDVEQTTVPSGLSEVTAIAAGSDHSWR